MAWKQSHPKGGAQTSFDLELLFLDQVTAASAMPLQSAALELDSQELNDLVSGVVFSDDSDSDVDHASSKTSKTKRNEAYDIQSDNDDDWN